MKLKVVILVHLLLIQSAAFSQDKIEMLILHRNYGEALNQIDNRISTEPEADLFLKKGLIYVALQDFQKASAVFMEGLILDPQNMEIPAELAEALSALGNHHDAVAYYEAAVGFEPRNHVLAGKLGRNYIHLNEYKKAYEIFERIHKTDSTNLYWNKQYAVSAHRIGRTIKAIDLYEKIISANPRDYSSYINLARLYQQAELPFDAVKTIEKGIENFPAAPGLYQLLGQHYFNSKDYDLAKQAYENSFAAGGDSAYKTLLNYGISLYFTKNEQNAIAVLQECAEQVVNDPYVLFYLSLSHKKLAGLEVAEAYMNAAIEAATPAYLPEMYHHLGQIYGLQRSFEKSIAALRKANELDPTNYEVLFEIATTYEEYNANKTMALNYYNIYLKEAGEAAQNASYALDRMSRIKEDLFFDE
jgi:tetratricopeptide (TPR) repeat protein